MLLIKIIQDCIWEVFLSIVSLEQNMDGADRCQGFTHCALAAPFHTCKKVALEDHYSKCQYRLQFEH